MPWHGICIPSICDSGGLQGSRRRLTWFISMFMHMCSPIANLSNYMIQWPGDFFSDRSTRGVKRSDSHLDSHMYPSQISDRFEIGSSNPIN